MVWKTITLTFDQPLEKEQEDNLIALFQELQRKLEQSIDITIGALNNPLSVLAQKITTSEVSKTMEMQLRNIKENLDDMMALEQPQKNQYRFRILADQMKVVTPLKTVDYWAQFSKAFRKKKNKIASKLGVKESAMRIEFGDLSLTEAEEEAEET